MEQKDSMTDARREPVTVLWIDGFYDTEEEVPTELANSDATVVPMAVVSLIDYDTLAARVHEVEQERDKAKLLVLQLSRDKMTSTQEYLTVANLATELAAAQATIAELWAYVKQTNPKVARITWFDDSKQRHRLDLRDCTIDVSPAIERGEVRIIDRPLTDEEIAYGQALAKRLGLEQTSKPDDLQAKLTQREQQVAELEKENSSYRDTLDQQATQLNGYVQQVARLQVALAAYAHQLNWRRIDTGPVALPRYEWIARPSNSPSSHPSEAAATVLRETAGDL